MWTEHKFISFDKTPVFYRRLSVPTPAKAIVILLHGMGEHGGRYRHAAEYFASQGIETILPDLRGFGQSGGQKACVKNFEDFHRDLSGLHLFIERNNKEMPVFLMGHSFGGLIASSYAAFCKHPKIAGIILSSPLFGIAIPVPHWRHALGLLTSYLYPNYTQSNRVKPETLTHDAKILEMYPKDKLIYHGISARLYREMVNMISRKDEIAKALTDPILIQQAGEDLVVSVKATESFFALLNSKRKEMNVYPGFYHEILNETGRSIVLKRMTDFILQNSSLK